MQEGIFNTLTDWTIFMNKLLTALTIAAFATTGAFAADAKKEEKAAAPAAAASKADAKAAMPAADKKAAMPAAAASSKK
jgi:hypothetical protein